MHNLLNTDIDLLALAEKVEPGPCLPAPDCIAKPVAHLLALGLLREADSCIVISDDGRAALEANRHRVLEDEEPAALSSADELQLKAG